MRYNHINSCYTEIYMGLLKKIEYKILHYTNQIGKKKRRKKLQSTDFSIISNNCFAGTTYEYLDLPYKTPTIGLYFFAPDYIKFIYNIEKYLKCDLKEIKAAESKWHNELIRNGHANNVIGKLDDIEIVFLHYKNFDDAKIKWNKRRSRVNFDKIIYKFNDQNSCTEKEIKAFHKFKAKNKIFFTSKPYPYQEAFQLDPNKQEIQDDVYKYQKK